MCLKINMTEIHASHSLWGEAPSYCTAVCWSAIPPSVGMGFSQIHVTIPNGLKEGLAGTPAYYKQLRGLFYCGRKTVHGEFGLCFMLHIFFLCLIGIKYVFGRNLHGLPLHECNNLILLLWSILHNNFSYEILGSIWTWKCFRFGHGYSHQCSTGSFIKPAAWHISACSCFLFISFCFGLFQR